MKLWDQYHHWEEAEVAWDENAQAAAKTTQVKGLKKIPKMVGMTEETARFLKWKSFRWMIGRDQGGRLIRQYLRHPLRYGWNYIKSLISSRPFSRDGDFFLYGFSSVEAFEKAMQKEDVVLVVGFSYCHKPFECPSGRFTPDCVHDAHNPICQQCFIGKCMHTLPKDRTFPVVIPTVHDIGREIFQVVHAHPDQKVLFLITACEMTLQMFADWGNMVGIHGIGVRLGGRICNTMQAFALSEEGIKPGLTVVVDETKQRMLSLLKLWRKRTTKGFSHNLDCKCASSEKVCED